MKVVFQENKDETYRSYYCNCLMRAFAFHGHDVIIWHNPKPIRDVIDEISPNVIFHNDEVSDKVRDYSVGKSRLMSTKGFTEPICDPLVYHPKTKSNTFLTDSTCIITVPEKEPLSKDVLHRMSTDYKGFFRVFSKHVLPGYRYCGWIPEEFHALALASSNEVVALSDFSTMNATLCNKKVTGTKSYTVEEVLLHSNIEAIKRFLPEELYENINVKNKEFLTSVGIQSS